MTVYGNVAFGLEMRKEPTASVRARVTATLEKVQLGGLEGRYPRQLSGGQQQRAALARALVIAPDVLLLDEPLANLDAKLREEMRFYVRSLQQEVGITTIYVTHDQAEAMVIADRIAVMFGGRIHQLGAPADIYHRPATATVAEFIGLTNFVEGKVVAQDGAFLQLDTSLGALRCQGSLPSPEARRARTRHDAATGAPGRVAAGPPGGGPGRRPVRDALREPPGDELLHAGHDHAVRARRHARQLQDRARRRLPVARALAHPQAR